MDKTLNRKTRFLDLFSTKANSKALFYTCSLLTFQQFTGISILIMYTEGIFASTRSTFDPSICAIIIGIVQLLASTVTPIIVDRFGRRILLIISGLGSAASLVIFFCDWM